MKIPMFENEKSMADWIRRQIEALKKNGLAMAKKRYYLAVAGIGREDWCKINNLDLNDSKLCDDAWADHVEWCLDQIKYHERKIKKYERELQKLSA